MTLLEAYVHVQQRLQNIAAFVYKNVETPELDYFWKSGTNKFIKLAFPNIDDEIPDERFSGIQASLDDLRVLILNNTEISITETTVNGYTYVYGSLPTAGGVEYRHLINNRSVVQPVNCTTDGTREVSNRLIKGDFLFDILENGLYKTAIASPVSKITGNVITVYNSYRGVKEFTISKVIIDYIKKPVIYTFATNGGTDTLEFPDDVCFKIIDTVVLYMAIIAEQNPQKIQFLNKQ